MINKSKEETREQIYNLVKEVHIQKPFEDVTGEPHYVTDEIMKIFTIHSQNREVEIRKEERDRLRELVSRHAFSIYDENLPSPVVSEQILLEALTPEQLDKKTYKEIKEEIRKTDYFKSLDEDGNPTPITNEDNLK